MKTRIKTWLFVFPLASCASIQSAAERELLDADRAFARATAEQRLEGWVAAFDVNGSQVDDQHSPITGHDAVRAHMGGFFADPANHLDWAPDTVKLSERGVMGSTSGRFRMWRELADGSEELLMTGRYFDVWRKLEDGSWKLLYDTGDADTPLDTP